jgi:hypothetical protein
MVQRGAPRLSQEEADKMAASMVTIALDHLIREDGQAATVDELLAVMGDAPLRKSRRCWAWWSPYSRSHFPSENDRDVL